jgi:hypothetical protein
MTTHTHSSSDQPARSRMSRWLLPAIAVGLVAAGLVGFGVVSFSTALYAGLFGGMLLIHGGHGGHRGHGGHGGQAVAPADTDLSEPSVRSQPQEPRSAGGRDDRAPNHLHGNETQDDDQRNSHSCH